MLAKADVKVVFRRYICTYASVLEAPLWLPIGCSTAPRMELGRLGERPEEN
jgi:hypothetical protein